MPLARQYSAHAASVSSMLFAGLGLAIVRALVEEQGGKVSAETGVGSGTTITIALTGAGILKDTS